LHGHTSHSKESLSFISKYASRSSLLTFALASQEKLAMTRGGVKVDLMRAYWTPALTPLAAFQLERNQIERVLGVEGMVSLTDHDDIEAPMLLRVVPEARRIPVSVEWSVPFSNTTLHLGIHNLPSAHARTIMAQLAEYTANPKDQRLHELLAMLDEIPEVLIVLNHPLWDLAGLGKERHMQALVDFVATLGMFVHAFELSGVRTWEENRAVLHFAGRWDQLVIGGGDRHGAEPNAVVNLTNATSFSELVHEIRREHRCHVLFMPQYAEPFPLRVSQSLLHAVREYPDYPDGSRRWDERVFHPDRNGEMKQLATLWRNPPAFIEGFLATVRMLEIEAVRKTIQAAMATPQHEMHFTRTKEAAAQWKKTYESLSSRTHTTKLTAWRTPVANLRRSQENADSPS
jgi:hypothetical protein